jgi:hypothetical protein
MFHGLVRLGISFSLDELTRSRPLPRRQSRQLSGSFIYVIKADDGLVKIGVSVNPSIRLAQLQRTSAASLALVYVGALRSTGYAIEAEAHHTLASYRQSGEWFRCPVEAAIAAIGVAAHRLGEPLASGDPRLVDEAVRLAANGAAPPHTRLGIAALNVLKFIIAIPLALVVWASVYLIWCIITCV